MLNKRCSNILIFIINSKKSITIKKLSNHFKVSERTIRYDLDKIDNFLNENNMPLLDRKPNMGISFDDSNNDLKKIYSIFNKMDNYEYVLSKDERIDFIIFELLQNANFITIDELANELSVSRGTISNDLTEVKEWITNNNLKLTITKGHGMKITGNEKKLRRAATKFFEDNLDTLELIKIIKESLCTKENPDIIFINKLFKHIDIKYIQRCINIAEKQMEATFSDKAFNCILIHLIVAIKRIQLGKDIIMNKEELKSLRNKKEFVIASSIAKMLEDKFKISIPEDEIGYITIHLLGSNVSYVEDLDKENWIKIRIIVSKLIEEVEKQTGYHLKYDIQLFNGLLQHIRPALYRLKHDIQVKNPLLEDIQKSFKHTFDIVKRSIYFIESNFKKHFSDDEVGYLALHFQASFERLKNKQIKKPNVLVVCATGIGTSKLVSARLQSMFNINIIDNVSYRELDKAILNTSIDVIVSTISLNIKGINCIHVNPFLSDEDINNLNLVFTKAISNKKENNYNVNNIINIIKETCNIDDYIKLKKALNDYFQCGIKNKVSNHRPNLIDILNEDNILLNVEAKDWKEAVRISGNILLKNNNITEHYIDAMVNTVNEMGDYIVILPGIAMPHARPEDGVKSIGMSFVTLKKTLYFGNSENNPVKLIIPFCSTDHISHMKALAQLMKIIEDDNFINLIISATNKKDFINLMLSYLN